MSARVLRLLQQSSPEKIAALRHEFRNAPKTSKLIELLFACKGEKISPHDVVLQVYGIKPGNARYAVFENRYYKLRKKIEERLSEQQAPQITALTDEEKQFMEVKLLLANGKFSEAEKSLLTLERACREKNIFELLPDVLDALIQARQSLNKIDDNHLLHRQFAESLTLYTDLMETKNLARQVYEVNLKKGISAATPLFRRMAKLDHKHKRHPRFKLIYNFVAGYYKVGAGGSEYLDKTNVTNRHIGVARALMQQHPGMPAVHYTATGEITQRYRLMELQAMCYYNALRFDEAAKEIMQLYASVMRPQSPMNRMKNEILFINVIHMLVAAKRYREAIAAAWDYMRFMLVNKRHEQSGYAYAEMANIHVSMYPEPSGYQPITLLKHINAYFASRKNHHEEYFKRNLLVLKAKLLITMRKYREAQKTLKTITLLRTDDNRKTVPPLIALVALALSENTPARQRYLISLKEESRKMKFSASNPTTFLHWRWMENTASRLADE